MNVTKFHNFIKLSDFSSETLDASLESFTVIGNINCCQQDCDDLTSTATLDISGTINWSADLSNAVNSRGTLRFINIQGIYSLQKQAITLDIDISNILDECIDSSCTLETHGSAHADSIKTAIDNWFLNTLGLTTSVLVSFVGNVITIEDTPNYYTITDIEYNEEEPYISIPFGQNTAGSNLYYFNTEEKTIYIKPQFFNDATEFVDGIYKFIVKWTKEDNDGFIQEENCSFIDITTKCRVASILQNILKEANDNSLEKVSGTITLLHYSLVNGSNCACNCDELCSVYRGLIELLDTIDPKIVNNCGC